MNNLEKEIKSLIASYNTLVTYYKKVLKENVKYEEYLAAHHNKMLIENYKNSIRDLKFVLKEK